jgi:hypothetical protein
MQVPLSGRRLGSSGGGLSFAAAVGEGSARPVSHGRAVLNHDHRAFRGVDRETTAGV